MSFSEIAQSYEFVGSKIALICRDRVVSYLRDDFAWIPDPGLWDFPGGEREEDETALTCALRETREEFGVDVPLEAFRHASRYESHQPNRPDVAFFGAVISHELVDAIDFGSEGQCWQMMPVQEFLNHPRAVRELQGALSKWLDQDPSVAPTAPSSSPLPC